MARLAGELALVTGSTSGLGRVVAERLAEEGAAVAITGRDDTRGRAVADRLAARGARVVFVPADLSIPGAAEHLIAEVDAALGGLTVLVNNAVTSGVAPDGTVVDVLPDAWRVILDVDLVAAASLCRGAIPVMQRCGHGAIVNVTSRAAGRGTPGLAAYTAAKAGLEALARSITADFGRMGIRCNTVQPGYILHEERDATMTDDRRLRLEAMQMTRLPSARDVAHAIAFLASGEAACITGVTLPVDGGSTAVRALTLG